MDSDNHAQALVEALEDLIIPIIHSHYPVPVSGSSSSPKTRDIRNRSGSSLEAQQLITALNRFVTALVKPSTPEVVSIVASTEHPEPSLASIRPRQLATINTVDRPMKPPLLQRALDDTHHLIFNRMPIRLMTFNTDGSGLGLIERGQLWQKISSAMERDYDEDKLHADIHQIKLVEQSKAPWRTVNQAAIESQAVQNFIESYSRYAILSHTWLQGANGEVTYSNWKNGNFNRESPGYRKLINFCKVAATDYKVTLGWMDTICIDKESSSELDESIRSMYRWYQQSHACITYLADTVRLHDMPNDTWFTRGWTLQELIAPSTLKFYNYRWRGIVPGIGNDKTNDAIAGLIEQASNITRQELDRLKLPKIPISRRMQWAATRKVTREEDASYSLMGIFGVSFSVAYGEGSENAFSRLAQAILNSKTLDLLDIANWGGGHEYSSTSCLLPRSVTQYAQRIYTTWYRPAIPFTSTHLGLHVSILLMPAILTASPEPQPSTAFGDYYATVVAVQLGNKDRSENWSLLEKSIYKSSPMGYGVVKPDVLIFGVLNFYEHSDSVTLPDRYGAFAIPFEAFPGTIRGVPPEDALFVRKSVKGAAISFQLKSKGNASGIVKKGHLNKHGITLRTLYL